MSLSHKKICSTPTLTAIGVLNFTNKVFVGGKPTNSELQSPDFSNGSSRTEVNWVYTSFNVFVLLDQLASLSDEWSSLKNYHVCNLQKANRLSINS